jgi:hypothetical protein
MEKALAQRVGNHKPVTVCQKRNGLELKSCWTLLSNLSYVRNVVDIAIYIIFKTVHSPIQYPHQPHLRHRYRRPPTRSDLLNINRLSKPLIQDISIASTSRRHDPRHTWLLVSLFSDFCSCSLEICKDSDCWISFMFRADSHVAFRLFAQTVLPLPVTHSPSHHVLLDSAHDYSFTFALLLIHVLVSSSPSCPRPYSLCFSLVPDGELPRQSCSFYIRCTRL